MSVLTLSLAHLMLRRRASNFLTSIGAAIALASLALVTTADGADLSSLSPSLLLNFDIGINSSTRDWLTKLEDNFFTDIHKELKDDLHLIDESVDKHLDKVNTIIDRQIDHSTAMSIGSGAVNSSASATGGQSDFEGDGGTASAGSTAMSTGSGAVHSLASATGGEGGEGGSATAVANASAAGGGTATAEAVAPGGAANATSTDKTAKGALAQAQSTAVGSSGKAQSTALTSFSFVKVQSTAVAQVGGTATTNAIAQGGGSGQAFVNPGQTAYAFSTALPDKAYSATLIDGAHDVAGALLGPRDVVFGTAVVGANSDGVGESATSTFDFGYGGDLMLGLIDDQLTGFAGGLGFQSMELTVTANGVELFEFDL